MANARPLPRRTHRRGVRRTRPAERVLLRRGERRRLEDRSTRDASGSRSSTRSPSLPSARSPSPRRRPTRCTSAPANRRCATRRASATACTSRPTPGRRGRTSASTTPSTSARVAVHPRNPNIVFVAAIGHLYAASPERGVFRTTDGGKTWKKVLYKDENVGAVEVVIDPVNPQVVYAGLWNTRRPTVVHVRADEWPGRRNLQVDRRRQHVEAAHQRSAEGRNRQDAASRSRRAIRAACMPSSIASCPIRTRRRRAAGRRRRPGAAAIPRVRSHRRRRGREDSSAPTTRGATWTKLSNDQALWGRGWYFEQVAVDPKNADNVYVPNVAVSRSKDGGQTWVAAARLARRRRLPSSVGLARRLEHDDRRERPGHDHHAQRAAPTIRATSRGARGSTSRRRRSITSRSTTASRTG